MSYAVQAFLKNRYSLPDNRGTQFPAWKMVTIDIISPQGQTLAVLQSEDSSNAIEQTLRNNGWTVTSRNEDTLLLAPVAAAAGANHSTPHPMPPQNIVVKQKSGCGCLIAALFIPLIIIIVMVIGSMTTTAMKTQGETLEKCISQVDTTAGCSSYSK